MALFTMSYGNAWRCLEHWGGGRGRGPAGSSCDAGSDSLHRSQDSPVPDSMFPSTIQIMASCQIGLGSSGVMVLSN